MTSLTDRFRLMARMRAFERACLEGVPTREIHGEVHLGIGQEAIAAGMEGALRDDDAVVSTHRNHLHAIVKGVPLRPLLAEIFERETGLCRGRGGHMHIFDRERNFSSTGIVGSSLGVALGHAYAAWLEGTDAVAVGITGEGGTNAGVFHEVMVMAGAWRLPLIVLVENNGYAISVPIDGVSATETIAERAPAYGAWGVRVDGTDVEAVAEAFARAVERARHGEGPSLVEATCYRFQGHYEGDPDHYRPKAEKAAAYDERDPLVIARRTLTERRRRPGGARPDRRRRRGRDAGAAGRGPLRPAPCPRGRAGARVRGGRSMTEVRTRERNVSQTIADAIAIEMERDERIVVIGEDVGRMGGVFGTTRRLQELFGDKRVRDTPISELGFTGMGVGLALAGYRPLVELMFVDFIGVNLEQVYNAMAKNHYMSGGTVRMPMVLKTAGGCIGSAAQHSQTLWGLFAHLPGMRVVVPSSPYSAKGLMASALESDDPVVYIEHKGLLLLRGADFTHGRQVPDGRYTDRDRARGGRARGLGRHDRHARRQRARQPAGRRGPGGRGHRRRGHRSPERRPARRRHRRRVGRADAPPARGGRGLPELRALGRAGRARARPRRAERPRPGGAPCAARRPRPGRRHARACGGPQRDVDRRRRAEARLTLRLDEHHAVVVGGAGALGTAICRAFADAGARVSLYDLDADAAARLVASLGEGHRAGAVDVTDPRRSSASPTRQAPPTPSSTAPASRSRPSCTAPTGSSTAG